MSKLNSNKINFNENDFLVEISKDDIWKNSVTQEELIINRAQNEAEVEIENAKNEAKEIIQNAQTEAQKQSSSILKEAQEQADSIIAQAQQQAEDLVNEANAGKNELLVNAQVEIEKTSQEGAKKGYEEGYQDAQNKFFEENEEKIEAFDKFCSNQKIIRDKILKNASRDIVNIIKNIAKKILLKEIDSESLTKIINNTIALLDDKENVTIVLSEKYAKMLYELQNKDSDIELNFEDFKQYKNFNVAYNKELPDDTIIVENLKERFCASVEEQLNKIIREILSQTQGGNIDIEEYDETSTTE